MYSRCSLQTQLTPSDALQRLSRIVGPRRSVWKAVEGGLTGNAQSEPRFVGIITGDRFQIRRAIGYRNHFLPIVVGRISAAPDGSRIDLVVRVRAAVGVTMTLWLVATLVAASAAVWHWWQSDDWRSLLALFLPAFGCVLILVGFVPERRRAVELLADALDATPASS